MGNSLEEHQLAGIFSYGTSLSQSPLVGGDGVIHYDIEVNDGGETDISYSTWLDILREAEALGVPQVMWPDYRTAVDLPVNEVAERNKALHDKLEQLEIKSSGSDRWFDFVVGLVNAGNYILYVREY